MTITSPVAAQCWLGLGWLGLGWLGWCCRSHGSGQPWPAWSATLVGGLESQRAGVDAVAVAGRPRPVVEDVAQVTTATSADHFGPAHEQAVVGPQFHRLGDRGLEEARPAGAGVELGVR